MNTVQREMSVNFYGKCQFTLESSKVSLLSIIIKSQNICEDQEKMKTLMNPQVFTRQRILIKRILKCMVFENIVRKGQNGSNQQFFFLFPQMFLLFQRQKSSFELHVYFISLGEYNTILSAYTKYRHLG